MNAVLPPQVSEKDFDRALSELAAALGREWVLASEKDRSIYEDAYALDDGSAHRPSAAVAPQNVEEIRAVLRIANAYRIPLWPVSRGKNLGYGEAAPLLAGSIVLDLSRMNRVLEVNEKSGYVALEPGVSFFDLYNHLQDNKIPLWLSMPGNPLGSVIGNALERGIGYSPYGENTAQLCGLEVVLPSGEVVRTGMGAMANSASAYGYPYGFGPHWDQMFVQSNFGIVTRAGLWLMPEPEATKQVDINLDAFDDLSWFIDTMASLRLRGAFEQPLPVGSYLREAMVFSERRDWQSDPGPISARVEKKIRDHFKVGWWSTRLTLYGYPAVIEAQAALLRAALAPHLKAPLLFEDWRRGEPIEKSGAGIPDPLSLQIANWLGGQGAHIDFSPVLPVDGAAVLRHARETKALFEQHGFDPYSSYTLFSRHIRNVNMIIFDRSRPEMTERARQLMIALSEAAAKQGLGEYRAHLDFMQATSDAYDFNDHALNRLNRGMKDFMDPNGVLAPGKNGIWPTKS